MEMNWTPNKWCWRNKKTLCRPVGPAFCWFVCFLTLHFSSELQHTHTPPHWAYTRFGALQLMVSVNQFEVSRFTFTSLIRAFNGASLIRVSCAPCLFCLPSQRRSFFPFHFCIRLVRFPEGTKKQKNNRTLWNWNYREIEAEASPYSAVSKIK